MGKILAVVVALAAVLAAIIGWRLHIQAAALRGPPAGSGTVEGTSIRVASRVGSRVLSRTVRRGDVVHAGQVLVRMDCAEPQAALAEAQARVDSARAQVEGATAQTQAAERSHAAAVASAGAARANAAAVGVQRDAAERERRRAEFIRQAAPTINLDQAESAAEVLRRQVTGSSASSAAVELQARAAGSQAEAARVQIDIAQRNVQALEASVARAALMVEECVVVAPRDAVVEEVYYEEGELPPPTATLIELIDVHELKATFYLPNAEIGRAHLGARAIVEADAFPSVHFDARVTSVGTEAEFTPRNIQTRTDRDRLVYPIEVRLGETQGRLRPGMPVQVTLP